MKINLQIEKLADAVIKRNEVDNINIKEENQDHGLHSESGTEEGE